MYKIYRGRLKDVIVFSTPAFILLPVLVFTHKPYLFYFKYILKDPARLRETWGAGKYLLGYPALLAGAIAALYLFKETSYGKLRKKAIHIFFMNCFVLSVTVLLFFKAVTLRDFLFSAEYGLFPYSPFLIFCFLGMRQCFREHWRASISLSAGIVLFILFYLYFPLRYDKAVIGWGNRYFSVLIPFLSFPLLVWYNTNKNRILKYSFMVLLVVSVAINGLGAYANKLVRWGNLPEIWNWVKIMAVRFFSG